MRIEMILTAEPRNMRLPEGLGTACGMYKFVIVQEGDVTIVIFGYTRSHFVLALWYVFARDMARVARHFAGPLNLRPPEMAALQPRLVGAGSVSVAYEQRSRVPEKDTVSSWRSETLGVETPEELRGEIATALLAHVADVVAVDDRTNPPLPQHEGWG